MKRLPECEFMRKWLLPYPEVRLRHLRYNHPPEKGVYWYWFSLFVRERDCREFGACISCGRPIEPDSCDAGHFCPASSCGRDLLFDPRNVNAECRRCNGFDEAHLFGYEKGLDRRYGPGTAAELKRRYFEYRSGPALRDRKAAEYEELIRALPSYQQALSMQPEKMEI